MHNLPLPRELINNEDGPSSNAAPNTSPKNILNNTQVRDTPAVESTICLVNQLAAYFGENCRKGVYIRDKVKENDLQRRLKKLVYSVLLTYRKDYDTENTVVKLTELEEVIWQTFVLRHHRRYDDGNSLDKCLQFLKERGHLEAGSDIRSVLKFLVALKGFGGDIKKKPTLAELTPRIVHVGKNQPRFLPAGPLQYGDTFLQSAEYRPHYMHFPPEIFCVSSSANEEMDENRNISPFGIKPIMELSKALPGTGVSPLLMGRSQSDSSGKILGALLQEHSGEVTPDAVLCIPELPSNAQGYSYFSHLPNTLLSSSPTPPSAVGSDEGYASSRAANLQTPEDDIGDVWETVLQGPPLTSRRTWETLDHVPLNKEKLFITEAGPESSHHIWLLYQELWGSLGDHHVPTLYVRSMKELCQDLLNLMIGVPSRSFLWSSESESFCVKDGLCYPGVTPEHLRGSLMPFVECGTLVRRLEVVCATPTFDTQQVLTQGSVYRSFTVAISKVLQVYRGTVFSFSGETHLPKFQERARHLLKKIRFVAHLCHISLNCYKVGDTPGLTSNKKATDLNNSTRPQHTLGVGEPHQEMLRGLNLLGELLNQIIVTKDQACLLLLVSIFKNSCAPFFQYLEDWIYDGVCLDPGLEFMIDVDGRSLLRRDRSYWTKGYTLRDQSSVPPFLRDVLQEAFTCGKALNLLKLCSVKNHLVQNGSTKHPSLQLCISGEELEQMRRECEVYAAHMDHMAAQKQVTAHQKAEKEREENQRLSALSSKKHAAIIKEIEKKLEDVHQSEAAQKRVQLKELKEEMLKAELRKREEKQWERDENRKIALVLEEKEAEQQRGEEKLRVQMELFYRQKMFAAERSEALARWRMRRCQLNEARKQFFLHSDWSAQQIDAETLKLQETENKSDAEDICSTEETADDVSQVTVRCLVSDVPHLEQGAQHRTLPRNLLNINSETCIQKLVNINENLVVQYPDDIKDSPNQEFSSVSDMTPSLMSTSSDFVDTPHDENLPDFEVDLKRSVSFEKNFRENRYSGAYTKSSVESVLYDRSEDVGAQRNKLPTYMSTSNSKVEASVNKKRVLEEEFGIISESTEGAHGIVTKDIKNQSTADRIFGESMLHNPRLTAEKNHNKVLKEEFGINDCVRETATAQDANANFATIGVSGINHGEDDENGNLEGNHHTFQADDINANLASGISSSASPKINDFEDPNANIAALTDNVPVIDKNETEGKHTLGIRVGEDEDNGNTVPQNMNEVMSQYEERCTQAAAIKQRVLNEEFHSTTVNKNTLNILRSKPVPSSLAAKNKQKVLETEYGISQVEVATPREERPTISYSRQVSAASTSSYKSCSFYERQTSGSTAFTTPDEERPILIDQVGGEVLKERGRSIHGHASDAVIHKLLWKHEPLLSPAQPDLDMSPMDDLLSAVKNSVVCKAEPYNVENLKLMGCEPLLDITGTALNGRPNTRQPGSKELPPSPTTNELSCAPIYFIRSIRMHLATQSRLVNESLLSEVLVQESLLDHFSALRALLLLHDAHFARALTLNLFNKVGTISTPAALLVPVELNNILNKSVSESCWSTSSLAENLSFAVTNIPPSFTHAASVVDCLELRYHVRWPHTLILDDTTLASYSRVWTFLASLHYSILAADDLFRHLSCVCRQDKNDNFLRCPQYHQVCLYRHEMHQFLLVVQAYVISQVHQISWSKFEKKLHEKVSSLDELYDLHNSLINSIISRCFLTRNSAVVHQLVKDVFSLMLRFRSQYLSHTWQANSQTGVMEHPAFNSLKTTHQEFQKHAVFLHKSLLEEEDKLQECW
ncbi:gamma-tubulin complex component 6-like isoform X2 [Homarus americanus]|uniref:gamma-tubulin complex component 6-like isoform X2 n=1 Tax=Homarus americanus TaxID=6706 RepID=UPI001C4530ED|nr:gamma-tubulin complex component 6-like isoform X2 [Homarus americanus]